MKRVNVILTVFIGLSLFGLFPIKSIYGDSSDNPAPLPSSGAGGIDAGLSSEEISSISDFQEQTKKSLEEANILIRNKELDKAKRKLENVSSLVRKKISIYEDKAKMLVSEEREDIAKIYYQQASSLSKIVVQISKSLEKVVELKVDNKIKLTRECLAKSDLARAQTLLEEALELLTEQGYSNKREIESLLTPIPELKQKHQARVGYEKIEKIVTKAREQTEENRLVELIKQGKDYLIDKNFEEAKIKFLEASKIRPENELALKYLAETEQAKKEYESRKILDKIENLIAEGKKYLETEQLDQADAIFRQALKMSPSEDKKIEVQSLLSDVDKTRQMIYNKKLQKQADEYIANGVENLKNNQYAKARANFEKALAVKPDYSEAEKWLTQIEKAQEETHRYKLQTMMTQGKEYLKNNQFVQARAKFGEILEIDSTYPEALRYLEIVGKAEREYKNKQQFEKIKLVVDNGVKFLEEGQYDKAESVFKEAVEMAPLDIKEQIVKIIEEGVNSFIQESESQKRADKYISDGIICLNNNEFDKAEEAFKIALNIIPEYSRGKEYLQRLEIAKLKYQNNQSLEQIDSTICESEELKKAELENNVSQLMAQIKSKIEESEKVLEREN